MVSINFQKKNTKSGKLALFGQKNVIFSFFIFFGTQTSTENPTTFLKMTQSTSFFAIMFLRVYATNLNMDFDIDFDIDMASFLDLGCIFWAFFANLRVKTTKITEMTSL